VTAAADGRTFVADAISNTAHSPSAYTLPRTFYLLRLAYDTGRPAELVKLPIPSPGTAEIEGIALSPDGTRLAVLYQPGKAFPATGPFTLRVYSVATGALLHAWTAPAPRHSSYGYVYDIPPDPNATLSWTADGKRVAFVYGASAVSNASLYLRQVDLTRPGSDLFADSAVILKIAVSPTGKSAIWCSSLGITSDGKTALCGAKLPKLPPVGVTLDALVRTGSWTSIGCAKPSDVMYPGFAAISLATKKLTQVLYQATPKCLGWGEADIVWASPSGNAVLGVVIYADAPSRKIHIEVVFVSHGAVTRLPWPPRNSGTLTRSAVAF
jgi:hypothetical protein